MTLNTTANLQRNVTDVLASTAFLDRAIPLLEREFSIIPLKAKSKEPQPGLGAKSRSKNPAVIQAWAERYPDANVGVCADGEVCILDTDGVEGLVERIGELNTFAVMSSPGKAHYYFRCGHSDIRNLELGKLGSLRAVNQYVVGPGSIHPDTGKPYTIIKDVPVAEITPGLLRELEEIAAGVSRDVERITVRWNGKEKIPEGMRQYFLRSQVGKLWDGEKTDEQLYAELSVLNDQFCDPPKPDGKVRELVSWVMQKEPNRPSAKVRIGGAEAEPNGNVDPDKDWNAISAEELINRQIPARQAIMTEDGAVLFYESSINQIMAWRGVGKTNFALGLANAFCSGGHILNFRADRPRRVLYLDGELPLAQLQERVTAFVGREHRPNLTLFSPEMLANPRGLNLLNPKDAAALKRLIHRHQAEILIIDSQSTTMLGDANKTEFQEARQNILRDLRWLGLCVIEMHHVGKTQQQRGLSRNDDILDVQMHLKRVEEWEPSDGLLFEMRYEKVRHAARLASDYMVTLIDGQWVRQDLADVGKVAELLAEGLSEREVAKQTGLSPAKVHRLKVKAGLAKLNAKSASLHPGSTANTV